MTQTQTKPITKQPQTQPSTTVVNQRLHGQRDVISIRIKPEVKEAFTSRCKQIGLSTCHVAEGLFTAWLHGVNENLELVNHSPTMTVNLTREVVRRRRVLHEVEEEEVEMNVPSEPQFGLNVAVPSARKRSSVDCSGLSVPDLVKMYDRCVLKADSISVQAVKFWLVKRLKESENDSEFTVEKQRFLWAVR